MTMTADAPAAIPAGYVARLDALFAGKVLATAGEAAALLEISGTQLARLGDQKRIFYRLKGKAWRFYAREDIERFIRDGMSCQSISPVEPMARSNRPTINSTSSSRSTANVVAFSAAQKKLERRQLENSKKPKRNG